MELKLVILDSPCLFMNQDSPQGIRARKIFSDLICLRQKCYQGVRSEFLNLDANDLCATHILLYDTSHVHSPSLVGGIRICYEERASKHLIKVPFYDRMDEIAPLFKSEWMAFKEVHSPLVNPNMLYISPSLGFNKTKLPLSDIILWTMAVKIREEGHNSYCAVINDEFKLSRWFVGFGEWNPNLEYQHPTLLKMHKVMFMNSISDAYLEKGFKKYGALFEKRDEVGHSAEAQPQIELRKVA